MIFGDDCCVDFNVETVFDGRGRFVTGTVVFFSVDRANIF